MTDRPILFSAPMIRALLAGSKSQTRRVLLNHGAPPEYRGGRGGQHEVSSWGWAHGETGEHIGIIPPEVGDGYDLHYSGPYHVGDHLWVREAWHPVMEDHPVVIYGADHEIVYHDTGLRLPNTIYELPQRWRSPIHMPRWASRITLRVTAVRVELLWEISCADAIAEGVPRAANSQTIDCDTPDPRDGFRALWNSINAKRDEGAYAWDRNPWVSVISFERIND